MPHYYFNVRNDIDADDPEGVHLADEAAARDYALESARELVCEDIKRGWLNLAHRIEVVDEERRPVLTATFGDAFELRDDESEQRE
jgi:hypothetical protein